MGNRHIRAIHGTNMAFPNIMFGNCQCIDETLSKTNILHYVEKTGGAGPGQGKRILNANK